MLVPSVIYEVSVHIGCRLARIDIRLDQVKGWHWIDILVWDLPSGSIDWRLSGVEDGFSESSSVETLRSVHVVDLFLG